MAKDSITIRDYDQFAATLDQLQQQLATAAKTAKVGRAKVADAATAAASAGVSTGGVAPVYAPAMTDVDTALGKLGDQTHAAETAVTAALAQLGELVSGMKQIQDDGAAAVERV